MLTETEEKIKEQSTKRKILNTKPHRITTRVPNSICERIKKAAAARGETLNHFVALAASERANAILEQECTINLSAESARIVFDLLENPPKPNEHLKRALQMSRELLCK